MGLLSDSGPSGSSSSAGSPPGTRDLDAFPPLPGDSGCGAQPRRRHDKTAGPSAVDGGAIPANSATVSLTAMASTLIKPSDGAVKRSLGPDGCDATMMSKRSKSQDALVRKVKHFPDASHLSDCESSTPAPKRAVGWSIVPGRRGKNRSKGAHASTSKNPTASSSSGASSSRLSPEDAPLPDGEWDQAEAEEMEAITQRGDGDAQLEVSGKPPEIYVYDAASNHYEISKLLTAAVGYECHGKLVNKEEIIIYQMNDFKSYKIANALLAKEGLQSHTYPVKGNRPLKVLIRGLSKKTKLEDVRLWVDELGYHTRKAWRIGTTNLFVVVLAPCLAAEDIYQKRFLGGLKVHFEAYREPDIPRQCYRCQRYGHSSEYCTVQPRCLKCGKDHLTTTCKKSKDIPACCANCKGPHPANYRKCPDYKAAYVELNSKRRKNNKAAAELLNNVRKHGPAQLKKPWLAHEKAAAELAEAEVTDRVKSASVTSAQTEVPESPEATAVAPETPMEGTVTATKPKKKKSKKKSLSSKKQTKGSKPPSSTKTTENPQQKAVKQKAKQTSVQQPVESVEVRPKAEQRTAGKKTLRGEKATSDIVQASSSSSSTFREDLAELMSLCRTFNVAALIKTAKHHLSKLANTKDPMERVFILMEAATSIGNILDG